MSNLETTVFFGTIAAIVLWILLRPVYYRWRGICMDCKNKGWVDWGDGPFIYYCHCDHGKAQRVRQLIKRRNGDYS